MPQFGSKARCTKPCALTFLYEYPLYRCHRHHVSVCTWADVLRFRAVHVCNCGSDDIQGIVCVCLCTSNSCTQVHLCIRIIYAPKQEGCELPMWHADVYAGLERWNHSAVVAWHRSHSQPFDAAPIFQPQMEPPDW